MPSPSRIRPAKRAFDLALAIPLCVLAAPIMLLIAAVIRWRMGTPVLFRQLRPGWRGELFELVKFRTMAGRPSMESRDRGDAGRLTTLGRLLRASSLDELPTLWNVLKGDMSMVGPRPLLPEYLPLYSPEQARRHEVLPGITGWAQVNGRNALGWEQKFEHDVWYVDHQSFLLDLRILLLTVRKVLRREGVNQDGVVTVHSFTGSPRPGTDGTVPDTTDAPTGQDSPPEEK